MIAACKLECHLGLLTAFSRGYQGAVKVDHVGL